MVEAQSLGPQPTEDFIQPFILEVPGLRGRLVRLGALVDDILTRHPYPEPVAVQLGQHLALAGALSSLLKFDGIFTLQTKSDGPLRMMVADVNTAGELRGYAEFDGEAVAALPPEPGAQQPSCRQLLGAGYIAYTVDQGGETERHQGIVELTGATLADTIHHYFRQSEQLRTAVELTACQVDGAWRSAALLLQQMPDSEPREAPVSDLDEHWRRALVLMATCRDAELAGFDLTAHDLLYRLFHEERVRVFRPRPMSLGCRCSRERIETILRSLDQEEMAELKVDGELVMTCQFCNVDFRFDQAALEAIYAP
jgi:molecular chaperone Hsp33